MNVPPEKRMPRTVPGSTGDILAFIDRYGTQNKDAAAGKAEKKKTARVVEKGKGGVLRRTLDLHGLTGEQAALRMRSVFESCGRQGIREVLVVHGQGHHSSLQEGPVLKNLVRAMLDNELNLQVKDYRSGLPREGGDGVTVVFLR